jgi:hypothetical protein
MAKVNPYVLGPGQIGDFIYVGELIPNQVLITNLNNADSANFEMTSGLKAWSYYGSAGKGRTASVLVRWPSGRGRFRNTSVSGASIEIGGDGIFPANSPAATKAKANAKVAKAKAKKKK